MNKYFKVKKEKGFSLLELLLVMGIIAALIVAAFIVYPKVRDSQAVDVEAKNIATIRSGLLALYASQATIAGNINNTIAIRANIFPENMLQKSGNTVTGVVNSFGGKVTLSATNWVSFGKVVANVQYDNVPKDVCVKLVSAVGPTMEIIAVGAYWAKNEMANVSYSIASVTDACSKMAKNDTITFSFQ